MAIITHDDAKKFLKLQKVESPDDSILKPLVDEICAAIESYCNRNFDSTARTEYYDGSGQRQLILNARPITVFTTVVEIDEQGNETEIATTNFRRDNSAGRIRYIDGVFNRGFQNWKITYTAGYTSSNMPKDLQLAAKIWLAEIFQKATRNLFGVSGTTVGSENVTYDASDMPDKVKKLLNPFKRKSYA